MRALQLLTAGFMLAAAMFVATMLVGPPTSEASAIDDGIAPWSTPLELFAP